MRSTLDPVIAFFAATGAILTTVAAIHFGYLAVAVLGGAAPVPAATTPAAILIAVAAGFAVLTAVLVFAACAALRILPWQPS